MPSRRNKKLNQMKKKENGLNNLAFNIANVQQTAPLSSTAGLYANNRYTLLTLQRTVLDYMYNEHGIVQTMIDQPVEDGFRGDIKISSQQLDEDNIEELNQYIMDKDIISKVKEALIWSRLFGGSGIIINNEEPSNEEFDPNKIQQGDPIEFYVADRWELTGRSPYSDLHGDYKTDSFSYYGLQINKSRVLQIRGKKPSSFIRRQLQGWGLSELERLVRSFNAYNKNNNVAFELLDEAKIDVYSMEGFNINIMNGQDQAIQKRVELVNYMKNYINALLMDKEDVYDQKQVNFGGLSEMLKENRMNIASDLKMPITKIFGVSSAGFNSGEDDIENYNSMIESSVRAKGVPILTKLIKIICRSLFGITPDIKIELPSLRVLTAVQDQEIKDKKIDRILRLYDRKLVNSKEVMEYLNQENVMTMETDAAKGLLDEHPLVEPELMEIDKGDAPETSE